MEIIKPRTLSGFMELLPAKQAQMERIMNILRSTYAAYGFAPLDTPIIEDAQILLAKGGAKSVEYIGEDAFRYCAKELFDTNTISGVKMVDGWVVKATDSSLVHVDLSNAKGIMPGAFDGCHNLESVVLPKNITRGISGC